MPLGRLIINNDFFNIFQIEPPVRDQDILDAVDKLANTHVDTVTFDIPIDFGTGSAIDRDIADRYAHPDGDTCMSNLFDLYDQGTDPYQMLVDRAREHGMTFLASIRLNDTHFKDQPFNPMVGQFYYDHLDDRVSASPVGRQGIEYDYRKTAVREHYLGLIRDALDRYDVDGFELNFTRNCVYFPPEHAIECAPILTQFVRDVRKLLDAAGEARDRKLLLSAMVPYGIASCRHQGLDLPAWARLKLIDGVTFSSPFLATFDHDLIDARMKLPGVSIHAGCDRNLAFDLAGGGRVVPAQTYRAMAANYLRQGADGIHLFNVMSWTMNHARATSAVKRHGGQGETSDDTPIDYDRHLLNELGNATVLERLDKLYIFAPSGGSTDGALPIRVPSKGEVTVRLRVGDDIAAAEADDAITSIELQTVSSDCTNVDEYTVLLNGVDLSRQYAFAPYADQPENVLLFPEPALRGSGPDRAYVRRHPARTGDLLAGVNDITIRSYGATLTITAVEIAVRYRDAK